MGAPPPTPTPSPPPVRPGVLLLGNAPVRAGDGCPPTPPTPPRHRPLALGATALLQPSGSRTSLGVQPPEPLACTPTRGRPHPGPHPQEVHRGSHSTYARPRARRDTLGPAARAGGGQDDGGSAGGGGGGPGGGEAFGSASGQRAMAIREAAVAVSMVHECIVATYVSAAGRALLLIHIIVL